MRPNAFGCWLAPALIWATVSTFARPAMAAPYLFLEDFMETARRLSEDMQNGRLDLSNTSPEAVQSYRLATNGTMRFDMVIQRGALKSVCPFLEVDYPNGRFFSYRTHHDHGSLQWNVRVSEHPERIEVALMSPSRDKGVPSMLPPVLLGNEKSIHPAESLGCTRPTPTRADPNDVKMACIAWPRMCHS